MTKKMMDIMVRIGVLAGLCLTSLYSYPLFHALVELCTVVIAGSIFVLAWNSRKSLDNNYLLFMGISCLFVGIIELLHTLAYKGMGVFQGFDANLPTRLWIAARYMESLSFLIAPFFFRRRLNRNLLFLIYAVATFFLLNSIFYWNIFPDCFIEGIGLTPFKKISEYIIILILAVSIVMLLRYRSEFEREVLQLLAASIFLAILAELSFTFHGSVYGLSNMIGHFFTLISFYLIYRAIIITGLTRPFDLLFRNLARSEAALKRVNEEVEAIVAERTADLMGLNEQLKIELTERNRMEKALHRLNRELLAISDCNQVLMHADDEQTLLNEVCRIVCDIAGYRMAWVGYAEHDDAKTVRPVAWAGIESGYIAKARLSWAEDAERGRGPAGIAIRSGQVLYVQDFTTDPRMAPWRESALRRGYRSGIALPLKEDNERVFGVLLIYSSEPHTMTPDEIELMEELAGDLSFGINVLRARTELKRTEEALHESEKKVRRKLDAILSPDTDIEALELSDIIDGEKVQKLMDEFYRLTNVGIGIIDLHGKVLVGTGWQEICTNFHRINPDSCRMCIESDLELSSNVPVGTFKQYRCKNNLWDIATPIMVGDKHMGNTSLGSFFSMTKRRTMKPSVNKPAGTDSMKRNTLRRSTGCRGGAAKRSMRRCPSIQRLRK